MSKVTDRRSKFAQLRALREAGKKAFDTYEVADADQVYDEVDENGYKDIVRERLNQDDFVVDDHGEGYADDGREEWDRPVYESDSEEETERLGRGGNKKGRGGNAKKHDGGKEKREADGRDIVDYFKSTAKAPPKTKVIKTEEDGAFMSSLLSEINENVQPALPPLPMPKKKRLAEPRPLRVRDVSKKVRIDDAGRAQPSPRATEDEGEEEEEMSLPLPPVPASDDVPMSDSVAPSSPTVQVAKRKAQEKEKMDKAGAIKEEEFEDEDEDVLMEVAHAGAVHAGSVNLSAARPVKKAPPAAAAAAAAKAKTSPYPSPASSSPVRGEAAAAAGASDEAVDAAAWTSLNKKLNVASSPGSRNAAANDVASPSGHGAGAGSGAVDASSVLEEDGSLRFFWIDYTEVYGSLCLFGKVLNRKTRQHVSCFVKVDNIQRKLYFLPRPSRLINGTDTGETVGMGDVYSEVDSLMTKLDVKQFKTKMSTRKYAFELPGIPREAKYLKLLYPYDKAPGETFSHVFGTNTPLFEEFVLWKNIMGPCWLRIADADLGSVKNASFCKVEAAVVRPEDINVLSDTEAPEAPPLTLMSLALRLVYDTASKKQEIMAISARIYDNVSLSDTTPAERLPSRTFTLIRPRGEAFPLGFETLARDRTRHRGMIRPARLESELLSLFLAQLAAADPDVIIGHQLEGVDYSVLLQRLRERKTPLWARLGRMRRSNWPGSINRVGGSVFAERQLLSGRLLCDLANDAGRSVMAKCQSWTLTEMCSLYLGAGEVPRRDIDSEAAFQTWARSKDGLMDYIAHMEADTYFMAALALRVQILPLTKNLTNLAGNSWARTLTGTRAERNEYILLHEFHRNKYICPDKPQNQRGRPAAPAEGDENGDADGAADSKKKDKYKGGLVFEPERGLYDKFVLVMDFNSLYPSIIQEYNICFTTVERSSLGAEDVPEVPAEQSQGVLPRLIATLVSRRRQVKSLMKDKTATPEQLATWDIKQLALKLTANSMYGCLGYTRSRFYARPLAVLVTYKGREILRSTKDLAESNALQVIYGDTDSVMINANVDSIADALRVGNEFKRAVNERYRLLEIDIDNVFRRILLQAKKKYAAINLVEQPGGTYVEKMEVKGLDMRRREYCALSKEMSTRILDEILSGHDTEQSVVRIHEYLREMAVKMRLGKSGAAAAAAATPAGDAPPAADAGIPVSKYIIHTQLGKDPTDYPNSETMPQVQAALREIARGKTIRKGDVVGYIIATGEGAPVSDPPPKRAFCPPELLKKDATLVPDVEWYLSKQIFPPVERLCANISGTSSAQLAENLGLDLRKFAVSSGQHGGGGAGGGADALEIHPLESQIPDAVRFRDCVPLQLRCRACKASSTFRGLGESEKEETEEDKEEAEEKKTKEVSARVMPTGIVCGHCSATLPNLSVVAQVEHAARQATARYYEGWLVCDDASCGQRTRQMSVYGARCLGPKGLARGCLGHMRYELGERALYNQLVYYARLFDVDRAKDQAKDQAKGNAAGAASSLTNDDQRELVFALAEHNRRRFHTVQVAVEKYLDKCGRRWVAMDTLFAKLGFAASMKKSE